MQGVPRRKTFIEESSERGEAWHRTKSWQRRWQIHAGQSHRGGCKVEGSRHVRSQAGRENIIQEFGLEYLGVTWIWGWWNEAELMQGNAKAAEG